MPGKRTAPFDSTTFLTKIGVGKTILKPQKKQIIFSQGDPADAIFYIMRGKVSISVLSATGKEAIIAMLERGSFFGESCLNGQAMYTKTATSIEQSEIVRIEKGAMIRALHDEPAVKEPFMAHLLSRNFRIEEDLVDQLFNSSEKRLARILLLMAHIGTESKI